MFARFAMVAALLLGGCGPRQLALDLALDTSGCAPSLPAGGSILYQVTANGSVGDGGSGPFCGQCLAVTSALSGRDALLAFLRQHAPGCAGVHPGTLLGVRLSAWSVPDCPSATAVGFCIEGPTVLVPDGTSDGAVALALTCQPQCASGCVPTTCAREVKDCGPISDGCSQLLECGTCKPPLKCGGGGTPGVCAK